jgi:iron complex outermembrane receptor protein
MKSATRAAVLAAMLSMPTLLPCAASAEPPPATGAAPGAATALATTVTHAEEVVVTATRGPRELQQVPATVHVIEAREIEERGHRYAGDELEATPGVFVQKTYAGTFTSVSMRGVPNQHLNDTVLALVDGVPLITRNDEVDLDQVPFEALERVEVVKGPMSALYGRGSIGGTLHYQTRTPPASLSGRLGLEAGQYGFVKPSVSFGGPLGVRQRLLASATYERSRGWRRGSERERPSVFAKYQLTPNARTAWALTVNWNDQRQEVASHLPIGADGRVLDLPGGRQANFQIDDAREERNTWSTALTVDREISAGWRMRAVAQYRDADTRSFLGFDAGFDIAQQAFLWSGFDGSSRQRTVFVEPQVTWQGRRARLVAGASWERSSSTSGERWTGEFGLTPDFNFYFYTQARSAVTGAFLNRERWQSDVLLDADAVGRVAAAYAQAELELGAGVQLTLGGRFDDFDRRADFAATASAAASSNRASNRHLSPKAALTWRVTPALNVYGAYGEGFSPAFGPIFSFSGRPSDLKPELARSGELGLKGSTAAGRLSFSAAAWRLERRDLLQLVQDGGRLRTVNAGRQRTQGLELEGRLRLGAEPDAFASYARYTFTDSYWRRNIVLLEFTGDVLDFSGRQVPNQPRHRLSLGADKRLVAGFGFGAWLDLTGDYFVDFSNTARNGAFTLLNARASYSPPAFRRLEAQLVATNLLDRRYFYAVGSSVGATQAYPGAPRQLAGALRLRF